MVVKNKGQSVFASLFSLTTRHGKKREKKKTLRDDDDVNDDVNDEDELEDALIARGG